MVFTQLFAPQNSSEAGRNCLHLPKSHLSSLKEGKVLALTLPLDATLVRAVVAMPQR
jgi:hypothetical protein